MHLILVRHGEALAAVNDSLRPLSPLGKKSVVNTAKELQRQGCAVDWIYHSTKLRAKQTAEILKDILAPQVELREKACLCPNDSIEEIISDIQGCEHSLLIVSHLPFLAYLAAYLVTGDINAKVAIFTPATAVILKLGEQKNWLIDVIIQPQVF